ncbi:ABC transporter permease, partial [bacterium]|nr:ABC transporter permease [bacterium]
QFECLVSYATLEDINRNNPAWDAQFVATYLLLKEDASVAQIERQLHDFLVRIWGKAHAAARKLHLQPLLDIHLHSSHLDSDRAKLGNWQLVLLLFAIAVGIVLMASINFVNLSTARAADRMREIGVRKSLGAQKIHLMMQFLGESVLLSLIALLLSLTLVELMLPAYSAFTDKALSISYEAAWFMLLGFAVVIGLVSGVYPALFLSLFQPVHALKGQSVVTKRSWSLRKLLVTTQFTIAVLLFIATAVVYRQLRYIQQKDLGFQKAHVLYTVTPSGTQSGNDLFKHELLQHSNILKVGRAVVRPLYDVKSYFPTTPTLAEVDGEMIRLQKALRRIEVGYDFLEVFDMKLVAGRSFSEDIDSDATEAFILNETAARAIGWPSAGEALGKALHYDDRKGTIVGVLEDFHFESLHSAILPFVLVFNRYSPMVFVKLAPNEMKTTIAHIQQTWEKYSTSKEPFQYQFMDTFYDHYYAPEMKLRTILMNFALLAVVITCLGVLGLTSFTIEQRKKEIGVRKVLGASVRNLMFLLSKEFLTLLIFSNLLAWPLAYYLTNQWLHNFAYRRNLDISSFVAGGCLVTIMAFITMAYQVFNAARTNPVTTLRYE